MAGHSKWAQIKRKKAVNDNRRGATISKHLAAIQASVRFGGSADMSANLALKNAIAAAKRDSVPQDNINRAIERALGNSGESQFEEVVYEGYGPNGVAILVHALTDNRNRTASEVRHAFSKYGGNMSGGVAWMFERKGLITLSQSDESIQELAIELGVDDFEIYDDDGESRLDVYTLVEALYGVAEEFRARGLEPIAVEAINVAGNRVVVDQENTPKLLRLLEALEDLDDVQNVYSNLEES